MRPASTGNANENSTIQEEKAKSYVDVKLNAPKLVLNAVSWAAWRYSVMANFCAIAPDGMELEALEYW